MTELLAPAGNKEALRAAVENGADAVYFGGASLNARIGASNFSLSDLTEAINYCHLRGVRAYITLNTLVKDKELSEAEEFVRFLSTVGADALIVQDIGLMQLIREISDIPIHASTQASINNTAGVKEILVCGARRVVLARELTLSEIRDIHRETQAELEYFVHGALCSGVSGQCLFSSMAGGRSGNRGRCAQPCRLLYQSSLSDKPAHLLSVRDLCMLPRLKDLSEAGVTSLKIEGRMKSPEYVAGTVAAYRKALDGDIANVSGEVYQLKRLFHRGGYSQGYLDGRSSAMIYPKHCGNLGIEAGRVMALEGGVARIRLDGALAVNDYVEFGTSSRSTRIEWMERDGKRVTNANAGETVHLPQKDAHKGDVMRKVVDDQYLRALRTTFQDNQRQIKVNITGELIQGKPLRIQLTDANGNSIQVLSEMMVQKGERPLRKEDIHRQLTKLGNTIYTPGEVNIHTDNDSWIPVSILNETRRTAVEQLDALRLQRNTPQYTIRARNTTETIAEPKAKPYLVVEADEPKTLLLAYQKGIQALYFAPSSYSEQSMAELERLRDSCPGAELTLKLPQITYNADLLKLEKLLTNCSVDSLLISNIGQIALADALGKGKRGDFSLNIFNTETGQYFTEKGFSSLVASVELRLSELAALRSRIEKEVICYGRLPLMALAHCIRKGLSKSCSDCASFTLNDQGGRTFPVRKVTCSGCVNYLYNADILDVSDKLTAFRDCNLHRFRVIISSEEQTRSGELIDRFLSALDGQQILRPQDRTTGHYFRGVE